MKHVHYDKILAKAANMDLVVFVKIGDNWEIVGSHDNKVVSFASHYEYFLCLPQHKEACLHWLNGGDVQHLSNVTGKLVDLSSSAAWSDTHLFMTTESEFRVKPKKEKRLIAIDPKTSEVFVATSAYIADYGFQLIEIEVEV